MTTLLIFDPIGAAEIRRELDEVRDQIVELMARERELDRELHRGASKSRRKRMPPPRRRRAVAR